MDNEVKQRNRRRKRAQRMQAIRENKPDNNDSGEEEDTVKPQRPPTRRKRSKEPLVEEDIIDGFAILGFKTYEDLEVSQSHPKFPRAERRRQPLAVYTRRWFFVAKMHAICRINACFSINARLP